MRALCTRSAHMEQTYDDYYRCGLQYGPSYRTLAIGWGGASATSVARLRARQKLEGTQVHPADLDDACCTSGAIVIGRGSETRLPFAVDDVQLQGAPGKLWAVR